MALEKYSNKQIIDALDCCLLKCRCKQLCCLNAYDGDCIGDLFDELKNLVLAYRTDDEKLERLRKVLENEE